ncbi:MAG TPA: 2,3-bisphosphoglycerate-independent phosphoglycerate mutase [Deltaproteobacteria bacterium]|nr:2,3-bisphosphoglycerate-independent phosphoglycerate mutase [Deltaproteobacteria bacterium]HPR54254.1 2,3-bisphosphoglycerate-independent phosphoglycerate mutase [Deltaproteobacteria bacterium]HXK45834.1 2,3-bisphosphoglycerate-independent phosphoglycerate mutase [Deltaproteobacteria bacterium]
MKQIDLMKELRTSSDKKIIMLVLDGLGGLPGPAGKTELEAARTPNMDRLCRDSICGLSTPIAPGITPGSGPGHLGLFGYDPLEYAIGRGVLEALGIGLSLTPRCLAARGNFCTVDPESGVITDRRAGRIPTEKCAELVNKLKGITLDGVGITVEPVKDYRFALILEGDGLEEGLSETDPQKTGLKPLKVEPINAGARKSADLLNAWIAKAFDVLKDERPANGCTLRGIAKDPGLPSYKEVYGLKACAIATYPMYKGLARLVGMDVLDAGDTTASEIKTLKNVWDTYDFFFFHVKKTDSAGEDGNFDAKVKVIEETDAIIPEIMALKPNVLLITGDHSTPSVQKSHSWHELPVLFHADNIRTDAVVEFGERACMAGGLGHIRHVDLMPLAMAHADKLSKYGA